MFLFNHDQLLYSADDRVVRFVAPPLPVSAEELVASPVFSLPVWAASLPFFAGKGVGLPARKALTAMRIKVKAKTAEAAISSGTSLIALIGSCAT